METLAFSDLETCVNSGIFPGFPCHTDDGGNNLALLYESTGRYEEAEPLYKQAVAIFTAALGPEHPNTKAGLANYEQLLKERSSGE